MNYFTAKIGGSIAIFPKNGPPIGRQLAVKGLSGLD